MKYIWSYFVVVLCGAMTSARITDFLGNRHGFHGNLVSGVKDEKVLTPPTDSGLFIDSNGYPGNSNGKAGVSRTPLEDFKAEDLPPTFFNKILATIFIQNKNSQYEIIPFSREDIINIENSELCEMICKNGANKPPCKCE